MTYELQDLVRKIMLDGQEAVEVRRKAGAIEASNRQSDAEHRADRPGPIEFEADSAAWVSKVAPVTASRQSESTMPANEPLPLTTGDIAHAFDGLRKWNEKAWKDTLGSPPKWLQACIVIRGQRGVRETRWNPVLIGAELVAVGHASPNSIRAKFQTVRQLKPWLDAWKTYEADNFDVV